MRSRLLLAALSVLLLAPPAAGADVRYASPNGATTGTCKANSISNLPCRLERAVTVAQTGDEIRLGLGTYNQTSAPVSITKPLTIHGPAEGARPVILDADNGTPVVIANTGGGTTLRHLEIRSQGASSAAALAVDGPATIEDVALEAVYQCAGGSASGQTYLDVDAELTGSNGTCLQLNAAASATLRRVTVTTPSGSTAGGASVGVLGTVEDSTFTAGGVALTVNGGGSGMTVRRVLASGGQAGILAAGTGVVSDSVATAKGAGAVALAHSNAFGPALTVRNVTAVATGTSSRGLYAGMGWLGTAGGVIEAKNVIARGDGADLRPQAQNAADSPCISGPCPPGVITISHSNFRTAGGGGTLNTGAGIQTGDPRFLAAGDLRLADDSPAIDAGTADKLGPSALDGTARVQGAAADLGAFERAPLPPPNVVVEEEPKGTPPGDPLQPPPPPADKTAPSLSALSLVPATVRRGKAIGLKLTSSEAGTLRVDVVRPLRGRKRGSRCVAGLRQGRRCTIRRVVRTLTLPLAAGAQTLRLEPGRLPLGRLALTVRATDAAGNTSGVARLGVRVRR